MRSHNSGNNRGENLHIWAVERKNYFSKTKIYFYKKTTPQLLEHIGLQNIKVGGKTNLGDLPLFVWCMLTFAINIFYKSRNKTPVTLDRERCRFTCDRRILEKKMQILYDRSKQIIIEICRLSWNCYLADSMNNALE